MSGWPDRKPRTTEVIEMLLDSLREDGELEWDIKHLRAIIEVDDSYERTRHFDWYMDMDGIRDELTIMTGYRRFKPFPDGAIGAKQFVSQGTAEETDEG